MNKRTLIVFVAVFSLGVVFSALAQSQSVSVPPDLPTAGMDSQGTKRYRMGPGDLLDVRVFGQSDLNSTVEIDEDGNISSLPFIEDPIPAKCRTEKEIQASITEAYSKYLKKPRVSVRIMERRSRQPSVVFGAVRSASRFQMMRRVRLHELLASAGGITLNASGTIQIVHTEPEMCPDPNEPAQVAAASGNDIGSLEVYKISDVKMGTGTNDPYIRPGDIVIVTEGEPIYITGAVVAPREIVMKDGMTLQRALAMAGGPIRQAKSDEIHVYRQRDGKIGSDKLKFNYDAIKAGKEPDVLLQAYDIIDVRQIGTLHPRNLGDFFLNTARGAAGFLPQRVLY